MTWCAFVSGSKCPWTGLSKAAKARGLRLAGVAAVFALLLLLPREAGAGSLLVEASGLSVELASEPGRPIQGRHAVIESPLALGPFGFVAGLGAFFAPCAFSLFPGYVSYYLAAETSGGHGERLSSGIGRFPPGRSRQEPLRLIEAYRLHNCAAKALE